MELTCKNDSDARVFFDILTILAILMRTALRKLNQRFGFSTVSTGWRRRHPAHLHRFSRRARGFPPYSCQLGLRVVQNLSYVQQDGNFIGWLILPGARLARTGPAMVVLAAAAGAAQGV
nr:hypothetical protein [uncultured Acidocella sp.]